ncbi:MAG: hypothetical protein M3083_22680 [Actinomycetota bacterium]|nr:hypothetical protein [Actinomycetota bacterium]
MTALVGQEASLQVLDALARDADQNAQDERLLARRIQKLRAGRAEGRSWQDLLSDEPHPGTLHLASEILARLTRASGGLRRAVARGLRAEGASIAAIAERFGVSRQRISTLLGRNGGANDSL